MQTRNYHYSPRLLIVAILLSLLGIVGCTDQGQTTTRSSSTSFTAIGEADRVAALYRTGRDLTALVMQYAHDGGTLSALNGQTVHCLHGGSTKYSYQGITNANQLENGFVATFQQCAEPIGILNGVLTIHWYPSQDNSQSGAFSTVWSATITIDGTSYSVPNGSVLDTSYNPNSGIQQTKIDLGTGASILPPNGTSTTFQYYALTAMTQTGSPGVTLSSLNIKFFGQAPAQGTQGTSMAITTGAPCLVNVEASSPVILGVSTPQTCSFKYTRLPVQGEMVQGNANTQSGLLNLSVAGTDSHDMDAGQFDWPTAISNAIFSVD